MADPGDLVEDDLMRLVLMCTHPALAPEIASALALRLVLGVSTHDVAALFLVLGAALSFIAGVGLLRFPDALSRLHAATKPQILGLAFIVLAIALDSHSWATVLALLPVVLLQVLTSPVAAHMIGRAGYRTGTPLAPDTHRGDHLP